MERRVRCGQALLWVWLPQALLSWSVAAAESAPSAAPGPGRLNPSLLMTTILIVHPGHVMDFDGSLRYFENQAALTRTALHQTVDSVPLRDVTQKIPPPVSPHHKGSEMGKVTLGENLPPLFSLQEVSGQVNHFMSILSDIGKPA